MGQEHHTGSYEAGLRRLVEAVQELSLVRHLDGVGRIVRHVARTLAGADGATFVLRDGNQCYYMDEEAIEPLWKGRRFPMDACISGWAMQHAESVLIEDIRLDSRIPQDAYRPTFVRSLAMLPVRRRDPIAAIGVYWATQHRATAEETDLLQALADATAVTLENVQVYEELEQRVRRRTVELQEANQRLAAEIAERKRTERQIRRLSRSDSLTGLWNRRGFSVRAEQELRRARREGLQAKVIFVDVDGLKEVNDRIGHHYGDAMIGDAATVLREIFSEADVIARWGGDEFVVLTLEGEDTPASIRKRFSAALDRFNRRREQKPYRLALSIGIADCPATGAGAIENAVKRADAHMYTHKREKRMAEPA